MTEADWLTGTDFAAHTRFAADRLSPRRQRLLAVGFCRAVAHHFDNSELAEALDSIERYADDRASAIEVDRVRQACRAVAQETYEGYRAVVDRAAGDGFRLLGMSKLAWALAFAANSPVPVVQVGENAADAGAEVRPAGATGELTPMDWVLNQSNFAEQSLLMRAVVWDVAGNPFRPVTFSPEWRTDTALALARTMYEGREFSAMPILADALQDAGCDNDDVLNHCRDTSLAHGRGCWVVDGVLGKE